MESSVTTFKTVRARFKTEQRVAEFLKYRDLIAVVGIFLAISLIILGLVIKHVRTRPHEYNAADKSDLTELFREAFRWAAQGVVFPPDTTPFYFI